MLPMLPPPPQHPLASDGPGTIHSPAALGQMYSLNLAPNAFAFGANKASNVVNGHHSFEFSNYLRSRVMQTYENCNNNNVDYGGGQKMRCAEDNNQMMSGYSSTMSDVRPISTDRFSSLSKPKISFSIESIIGIK